MNQIGDIEMGDNKFGLGFSVTTEKGSSITPVPQGTFAWGGIYSTSYWADPKEKIVGLFYKQLWNDPADESSTKFQVMTYSALME